MERSSSEAERFIGDLEGLLRAAREAAAATLLSQWTEADPSRESSSGSFGGLSVYACTTDTRQGRLRVTVQLEGDQSMYEGAAERRDWTETTARVAARAALAALNEWGEERRSRRAHRPRPGRQTENFQFGLGDVVEVMTNQGAAVIAVLGVRVRRGGDDGSGPRVDAFAHAAPAGATGGPMGASTDAAVGAPESVPWGQPARWLLGSSWTADDSAAAAARAVVDAWRSGFLSLAAPDL